MPFQVADRQVEHRDAGRHAHAAETRIVKHGFQRFGRAGLAGSGGLPGFIW